MKNKNFNPYRLRSYTIVFGLLILSFTMVFGSLLFISKLHPDFPLVFSDANNRLMVITKSNNSKNDIALINNANISYANNDTRYLLYARDLSKQGLLLSYSFKSIPLFTSNSTIS